MTQQDLLHRRIEIPVHYDAWMQGARTGVVTSFRNGRAGQSDYVLVKMDNPRVRRRIKLWRIDWEFIQVIC